MTKVIKTKNGSSKAVRSNKTGRVAETSPSQKPAPAQTQKVLSESAKRHSAALIRLANR